LNKSHKSSVVPIVLCGGSGSRLWPLSRESLPKQFVNLIGNNSSFQQSLIRSLAIKNIDNYVKSPIIITNENYRFIAQYQAKEISNLDFDYILEPESKNTAPALTLAALKCNADNPESIMVVSSSDHYIPSIGNFNLSLNKAIKLAKEDNIVLIGIKPSNPTSEFGYIECESNTSNHSAFDVLNFHEKPALGDAKNFLQAGNFLWNAGIFVIKTSVWLNAIKLFNSDIYKLCKKSFDSKEEDLGFIRPNSKIFKQIPKDSIDYAVLQKCKNSTFHLKVVVFKSVWHDLGTWHSFWELLKKTASSNVIFGDVIKKNISNSVIFATSRLVIANNIDDIVLIETPDVVMVRKKSDLEGQKIILDLLSKSSRVERSTNRKEYRPWGWFDVLDTEKQYKVKKILLNPKSSISLQSHSRRSEHWIVIKGQATVTSGNKTIKLNPNESFFIPKNMKHRLCNNSKKSLEIIEVQVGSYLGEDDIVRYSDKYNRKIRGGL